MSRFAFTIVAWVVGWVGYMIAMVLTVYDGIPSLMFQPIMAAIASALAVGVGLFFGLIFRLPLIGKFWRSSWIWAALLAGGNVLLLCCGKQWGITETFTDSETQHQYVGLRSSVALVSYFVLFLPSPIGHTRKSNAQTKRQAK